MRTLILAISGKQGSGKTTLSKALVQHFHDDGWYVAGMKFADVLYEIHDCCWSVMASYGIPRPSQPDGDLLQLLGTEWGRKTIDADLWVKLLKNRMDDLIEATRDFVDRPKLIIVDDARFVNEIEFYDHRPKAAHVVKLRLEAAEHVRKARAEKWRINVNHPSEISLDSYTKWNALIYTDVNSSQDVLSIAVKLIEEEMRWIQKEKRR